MKRLCFWILILLSFVSFSQDYDISMNVTKTDLTNNSFEKDPNAEAILIYDYGNAFFNKKTWRLNIDYKQKIKILSKEGLDRGQIEIPLYIGKNSRENIKNIVVRIYNLENDQLIVSKMDDSAIYREKNENFEIVKLVFPNVKVGSVITYSYTKTTSFINKYAPWYFQLDIPSLYSEYNASIPGNYDYHIKLVGTLPLKENKSSIEYNCLEAGRGANANCAIYKYVMTDIPAYKEEKYTTTEKNYLSRIEYELSVVKQFNGEVKKISKTWQDVDSELKADSDFGRQINKKKLVKDILPSSIINIVDDTEKAKAIYQFVLDNYKWNKKSGRYDASIKRLLEEKGGNAFEINLLLQNLLYSQGLESYPMLLSTRDNGLATKVYPVITDFNYAVIKLVLEDQTYYLDATMPYLNFGELPFRCLNQYARVYDIEYGSYWEDIIPKDYSSTQIGIKYKLGEDNLISGKLSRNIIGYNSHSYKKLYYENANLYRENLKSQISNSTIKSHKVLSKSISDKRFSEEIELTHEEEFIGDKIYFNPFLYKFYSENPFKLEKRTYPIDFGFKQAFLYSLEIDLGEKLSVVELPKDSNLVLPNKAGLVTFSFKVNGDKLSVYTRIKLDKAIYESEYYDALKSFMSKIIETQNNTVIVLEKK
ncbi:DUF3857 domain-containing protein [uncultured Winogradskyella sp.]|uniref:DUF3857 domain-containing protein n=1 Tax=uncultured Winogradskyella sp. TaxID=395353 RepID=UPI00261AF4B2|nr:DUF3857 domain-containing protein [uncultured Winogradskyella sp.]